MMKTFQSAFLICLPLLMVNGAHASVLLLGSNVTGSLTGNGGPNVFDPANLTPPISFVPAGDLNAAGTTVTIQDPATEFGAASGDPSPGSNFVQLEANFTDAMLSIDYQLHLPAGSSAPTTILVFQFMDAAFAGLTVHKTSDTFAGGLSPQLSGTTLTLTWAGENITASTDNRNFERQASFTFDAASSPVPEPGSLWLMGCGVAIVLARSSRLSRSILSWRRNG